MLTVMSADPAFGGSAQEDTAWCRVDEMVAESRTSFRSYLVGNWFVESCDGADCRNGSMALENGVKQERFTAVRKSESNVWH